MWVAPEIGKLTNLTELELKDNNLTELPPDICNLTKLEKLDLRGNPLDFLTAAQETWIARLKESGCEVLLGGDKRVGD